MNRSKWISGVLVLTCTIGLAAATLSQQGGRRPNDGPPGGRRGDFPDFRNMTPQQREQMFQKMVDDRLRDGLKEAGFTQVATQNAVLQYAHSLEADRRIIRDKAGKLRQAMQNKSSKDAQVATLLSDLRKSVAAARQRREKARSALNAKTGFVKKPKLDATLTLMGLGGDESAMMMGGFGGRGFGGRGFGGPGGPGGPRPGRPGGPGGPRGN